MSAYSDEMFELEKKLALAEADGDSEDRDYLARTLENMGAVNCAVCGTMIRFHHLEGWGHEEQGMDHDARPDRVGYEWPEGLVPPGGRIGR